jgi:hypothetical protein
MADQRLERLANKLSSLNADWQLMEERFTKRMEKMMAGLAIKLQPFRAKDPSCLEVTRAEEQPTKETPPSPSPLENHPQYQPHKLPSLATPTIANPNILLCTFFGFVYILGFLYGNEIRMMNNGLEMRK